MKSHHYWKQIAAFKGALRDAIPTGAEGAPPPNAGTPSRVRARQFGIVGVCGFLLWRETNPFVWIPLAILQGFTSST
jgi:hypothetical protein